MVWEGKEKAKKRTACYVSSAYENVRTMQGEGGRGRKGGGLLAWGKGLVCVWYRIGERGVQRVLLPEGWMVAEKVCG